MPLFNRPDPLPAELVPAWRAFLDCAAVVEGGRSAQTDYRVLKSAYPLIPSLEEVVQTFGRRVHLMVELKHERFQDIGGQRRSLQAHFAGLAPVDDFHLMSLSPEVLDVFDVVPAAARLPIAQANAGAISRLAISKPLGGLLGHYLLVTGALVGKHAALGQNVGTGFINSVNCLFREVNRNITWIFSNRAVALQAVADAALNPIPLRRRGAG